MDPLSVTSGVVGIIAFAFQLAKAASKIRTAVGEIQSAPKEARNLTERLSMLETSCQLIGMHLDQKEALKSQSPPPSLDIVSKALAQFLAKAQELEQMLSNLTSSNGPSRTPWLKSDTACVSRLRLVLRKDKINSLVQEIDRVISLLQFAMQVDLWTSSSIPHQFPSPSVNGTELMNQSLKLDRTSRMALTGSVPSQYTVPWKTQRANNQSRRTFRYLDYVTWTITDGWIGDEDESDTNRIIYRRGNITLRLPCTSTRLNIHYDGGMGTPSYALNIVHIIEGHSELGLRLRTLMRPGSDLRKLHEMVSKRELSIYSSFRLDIRETNLFFLAVSMRWAEGCRYLLQHDFRNEFQEANTPPFMTTISDPAGAYEVTEILLSIRPQDTLEMDMKYLLDVAKEPEYFTRYLEVFMNSPGVNCANLLSSAWVSFTLTIFTFWNVSIWIPALQYFIEHGVDTHQPCNPCGESAYMEFLRVADHPFTADDRAYKWLNMLKACGVDLSSYFEAETALIQKLGLDSRGRRKRTVVHLDYDGLQIPSWRWALPTEGSAVEAFGEFMNVGSEFEENLRHRIVFPTGPDDLKAWKRGEDYAWWAESCFPFCLSPIDYFAGADDYRLNEIWCRATYNRAVEIRDRRFARRQARKWRKAHPGEEPPSNKMPGTWVD